MSEVLVTGGSGLLGRAVVTRLAAAGHSVRVLTRSGSAARTPSPATSTPAPASTRPSPV